MLNRLPLHAVARIAALVLGVFLIAETVAAQPPGGRGGPRGFGGPPGGQQRGPAGGPNGEQGAQGMPGGPSSRGGGPGGGGPSPVLLALDADSNQVISAAEIANASATLAALDANGDGQLTQSEVLPQNGAAGRPRGGNRPNGGNAPTAAQFVQRANTFDADGDGVLNQTELAAMAAAVVAELNGQ